MKTKSANLRHLRRRRSHGFATTFALAMIVLVGAALLAVTTLMATDVRRTTDVAVDAQLRQLLHAGAVEAMQYLHAGTASGPPVAVELPPALRGDGAELKLQFRVAAAQEAEVLIEATFAGRGASQVVLFSSEQGRWNSIAVESP